MLNTDKFFESFDKAGFLKPVLWTPSSGLPGAGVLQSAKARFRAPTRDVLQGEASANEYSIEYASTALVGLRRGESITVDGIAYKVREDPDAQLDGTRLRAALTRS